MIVTTEARAYAVFRSFHPATRVAWQVAPDGHRYWLTRAQVRVAAIAHRDSGKALRVRDVAAEARVSTSTAYRALRTLARVGQVVLEATRGRLGRTIARWLRPGNVPPVSLESRESVRHRSPTGGTFKRKRRWRSPADRLRWEEQQERNARELQRRAKVGMDDLVREIFGA
jgi:hypothetical protein